MTARIIGALLVTTIVGCASAPEPTALHVSAAASLADVFAAVEAEFEARYPDVDVVLNLAGSSALREQIIEGAPVDVFASASPEIMEEIAAAGLVSGTRAVFARNRMQLVVPAGNPGGVDGLADLADPGLFVGLCAPGVPCGDLARQVLANAGVEASVDTNEPDVRALLAKVAAAELDAAIVYQSDLYATDVDLEPVPMASEVNVAAIYEVSVVGDGGPEAESFVAFLLGSDGRRLLADHGFGS